MYRIRLPEGEEAVFRSAEELARAVASGAVSAKAKIYDPVGDLWLPIEWNPDYCVAASANRPPGSPAPAGDPSPEAPPPAVLVAPSPWRRLTPGREARWPRLVALSATGLVTAGALGSAVYLGLSRLLTAPPPQTVAAASVHAPRPGDSAQTDPPPTRSEPAPVPAQPPLAVATDSGAIAQTAPPPPPATAVRLLSDSVEASSRSAGRAASGRHVPSYAEAYADARAELDDDLASVGFRQLFLSHRLLAAGGPHTARRAVAAAGNIVRAYRAREVMLEQSFRPVDSNPAGSLRETFEAAEAARSLLADCDSLFGVLEVHQGRYSLEGSQLRFTSPEAGRAYATLQGQITRVLRAWEDSTASRTQVVLPRLLRAFRPPPPAGR